MRIIKPALKLLAVLLCPFGYAADSVPEPLQDPIPEKILKGDIVVEATQFMRVPQTADANPEGANRAYARIQYLLPIRDGSGRLVINDLRGLLYVTDEDGSELSVYLDIREQNVGFDDSMFANETGLAGFAFHPEFAQRNRPGYGKFYTAYSSASDPEVADYLDSAADNHESVIREWSVEDPSANRFEGTSREVFRIGQFAQNHNIGTIKFNPYANPGSPDYGVLYVSMGDGGGAHDPYEYGQSLREPMAGIMRIDPLAGNGDTAYGIPADNPFIADDSIANEIWAYGLRHTQQFSFDSDGRVFMSDIGQSQIEEVNIGVSGANYGWRLREGTFATAFSIGGVRPGPVYPLPAVDEEEFTYPVAQYDHDEGNAISSGFVYRGSGIPELQGKYVFSDLVTGRLFYIEASNLTPGNPAQIQELRVIFNGREREVLGVGGYPNTYAAGNRAGLRLGIDAAGELYLLTKGDGWIRKLVEP
jgi:glucose/arabinose dehydrogenase